MVVQLKGLYSNICLLSVGEYVDNLLIIYTTYYLLLLSKQLGVRELMGIDGIVRDLGHLFKIRLIQVRNMDFETFCNGFKRVDPGHCPV